MMEGFEAFPEEVTKWEAIKDLVGMHVANDTKTDMIPKVQLLPRQDVTLYGTIPKLEQRIYTKCKECRVVFNPRNVLSHKNCAGKSHHHSSSSSHGLRKTMKSRGNTTPKKSYLTVPPPPLFVKPVALVDIPVELPVPKPTKVPLVPIDSTPKTAHSPKSPKPSNLDHPQKPLIKVVPTTEAINGYSGSKHKKSRKSNSVNGTAKQTEEYNPDIHCGVIDGGKPPCTRSITCSNHRIQLRKLVPGRSKDVHQLMAERKAAKDKLIPMEVEEKEPCLQITEAIMEIEGSITNQDSNAGIVPVVYMPMSPISSPVEFVKIGENVIRLESPQSAAVTSSEPALLQIPSHQTNIKMYKTHPKPYAVPSYCMRKVGGAVLLANEYIESQRNDILTAIRSGQKAINHRVVSASNHHHYRPGALKAKSCKASPKRASMDKSNNVGGGEGKQAKLAQGLNGFVLHSSISEGADAPHSEKFSFLGTK